MGNALAFGIAIAIAIAIDEIIAPQDSARRLRRSPTGFQGHVGLGKSPIDSEIDSDSDSESFRLI